MSGSRRLTAQITGGAAVFALSAGLFALGAAHWTSTALASVPAIPSDSSSSIAKNDTSTVRVILQSMYQPTALETAGSPIPRSGFPAPLAQKGEFSGTIVFSADIPVDQAILFRAAQ